MNFSRTFFFGSILLLTLLIGAVAGTMYTRYQYTTYLEQHSPQMFAATGKGNKMNEVIATIFANYVDTLNQKQFQDDAISSILSQLDPHSSYIPAEDIEKANEDLVGSFDGVGIEFNLLNDTIYVANVIPDGPSAKLGIQQGDRIIAIQGEKVANIKIKNDQIIKKLRGPKGSKVAVTILRRMGGKYASLEYTISRGPITLHSIDAAYMLTPIIGYVKISNFGAKTYEDFMTSTQELKKQGMQKLVLDLRDNPGGYLNAAVQIADEFLENKKLIVYTKGNNHSEEKYDATGDLNTLENTKVAVLINESSASASEIVSGALQDNDKGIIIGRRSFGKGLVQAEMPFSDGSAMRLTIARYYTPTGRCIQRPYEKGHTEEYYVDMIKRLESEDTINVSKIPDSLKFKTAKGKIVYGGGGITPDVKVKLDTNNRSRFLLEIYRNNVFNPFVYEYWDRNKATLQPKLQKPIDIYNLVDRETLWQELLAYAASKKVVDNNKDAIRSKNLLIQRSYAQLIRLKFGQKGYYQIENDIDPVVKKAIEVL